MRAWTVALSISLLLPSVALRFAQAAEIIAGSPLRAVIVEHVFNHPDASLKEVIAFANASLLHHGLDFEFSLQYEPPNRQLVLESGTRRFVATRPEFVDVGPCGEHWFTIPVLRVDRHSIDMVIRGERITVRRPADLYLDPMRILSPDQKTVIHEIEIPRVSGPDGVATDGSAVFFIFGLGEKAMPWWQNVRTTHPLITSEYRPFLLLQVSAEGVRFSEDLGQYEGIPEPYEFIENFPEKAEQPYMQRERFLRSGLVVEFYAPCT